MLSPRSPHVMQWPAGSKQAPRASGIRTRPSFDRARLQLLELLLVVGPHLLQELVRRHRLLLVDLGESEADMDQDPVARPGRAAVGVEQAYVDVALDPYDVNAREPIGLIDHLDYLAWNRQTHFAILPQVS